MLRSIEEQIPFAGHFKHSPTTTLDSFSVLFLITTEHRRDELLRRMEGERGPIFGERHAEAMSTQPSY
jgi:hypothetical protein